MKSFTDIEQSKKLAEILPVESADMCYALPYEEGDKPMLEQGGFGSTPCWSLAALVAIPPVSCDNGQHYFALINNNLNGYIEWLCCYENCNGNLLNKCYADNPVDACYKMIMKLHNQKLL